MLLRSKSGEKRPPFFFAEKLTHLGFEFLAVTVAYRPSNARAAQRLTVSHIIIDKKDDKKQCARLPAPSSQTKRDLHCITAVDGKSEFILSNCNKPPFVVVLVVVSSSSSSLYILTADLFSVV